MGARSKRIKVLTPKQSSFIKAVVKHPDQPISTSAIQAGYSPANAASSASKNLSNPDVIGEIRRIMDQKGLTNSDLMDTLKDGLNATKPDPCGPDQIKDHSVRHKYLETALKLKGALNNVQSGDTNSLQLNLTADTITNAGIVLPDGSVQDLARFLGPKTPHDLGETPSK